MLGRCRRLATRIQSTVNAAAYKPQPAAKTTVVEV